MQPVPTIPEIGDLAAGRYRILEELGRGGYGVVFLARQEAINRNVAIKFLLPEVASDPNEVERFRREVFHASGLEHPNTITLFDYGRSPAGLFFVVMEYLEGLNLRTWLHEKGTLTRQEARRLLEQILGSLDEAHSREIVHRDLKPENIFLNNREDDRLHSKVLDFGLSKFIGDPRSTLYRGPSLTAEGEICGTPQYMSPEHAYGEHVGPSGDVYSLGLLIYEALVGKPAFDGSNPLNILLKQVKEKTPELPEEFADTELAEFVRRSTMKKAEDRFADAGKALEWLYQQPWEKSTSEHPSGPAHSIFGVGEKDVDDTHETHIVTPDTDSDISATQASPERPDPGPQPIAKSDQFAVDDFELRVAQTALIGRRRTLARLDAWLSHSLHSGGFFAMTGDAGIGKTAILNTWCSQITTHQRLYLLRGAHPRNGAALSGLSEAFSSLIEPDPDNPAAQEIRQRYGDQLTNLAQLFEQGTSLETKSDRSISTVAYHLVDTLEMLARSEPVLLILEDFHNCDPFTQRFLDHLLNTITENNTPLAILVTARQPKTISSWKRAPKAPFTHWPLPALTNPDMVTLLQRILPVSNNLQTGILKLASGNPALLLHLCRYLLESGRLQHHSERDCWDLDDPSTPIEELVPLDLQQLIIQRADRYLRHSENESALRSILHRAVLLGDEFDVDLLETCLRAESLPELAGQSRALLAELAASGLLHRQHTDESIRYCFVRPLHRASLVRMVESIDDWRAFHETAADALIARRSGAEPNFPDVAIADHLEQAGQTHRALPWWLRAANQAESEHRHRDALQMLRRAEVHLQSNRDIDPEVAGALRAQQGRLSRYVGEFGPAEDALREANSHAQRSGNTLLRAQTIESLAEVVLLQGRLDEAEDLLDEVGDLYHVLSDIEGKRRVRFSRANLSNYKGQYAQARQLFHALQADIAEAEDPATLIGCLLGLARCDYASGNLARARELIDKALRHAEEAGAPRAAAAALTEAAHIALFTEGIEAAEGFAHQALTLARREDDILSEANAHLALGLALRRSTHLDRARFHAQRARELHEGLGYIYGLIKCVLLNAEIFWLEGNTEQALLLAEDSERLHHNLGDRHGLTLSLLYKALFLIELKRPDEGQKLLSAILADQGRKELGLYEPQCLFYLGMAFEAQENIEEALASYGEAQAIAHRMGHRELLSLTSISLVKLQLVMGDIETARQEIPTALREAEILGHASANMFALLGSALLARLDRDPQRLRHFMTQLRTYLVTPNAPDMRLPQHLKAIRRLLTHVPPSPRRSALTEALDDLLESLDNN